MNSLKLAYAAITAADNIRSALESTKGTYLQRILLHAEREASEALIALIDVDPEHSETIRNLQNQVHRFQDLVLFMNRVVADGDEADRSLSESQRDELLDLLEQAPPGDYADA